MSEVDNPMAFEYSGPYMPHIHCDRCKAALWPGAKAYKWHDQTICTECFHDAYTSMSESDVADAMGVDEISVEDEA